MKMTPVTALFVIAAMTSAVAQDRSAAEQRNVMLIEEMFAAGWGANERWEDFWRANMTPGFVSYFHAYPPIEGVENAIAFNRELFVGFPGLEMTIEQIAAENETVVVRGRLEGAHDGTFLGVPATGAIVDVPDVTLFQVENGKITEMRYFTDLMAVMAAIGAVPKQQ